MSERGPQPHDALREVVERASPLLWKFGFHFEPGENAVSSGGPFENGFFRKPPIQIGLIVRGDVLGCPSYEYGAHNIGHDALIDELGRASECLLRFDSDPEKWRLYTTDGRTITDAFLSDLETIILPAIRDDPRGFQQAIISAREKCIAKLWRKP